MSLGRLRCDFNGFQGYLAGNEEEFNVISPLPIHIKLDHQETDDALAADVDLQIGDLTLVAAPQAVSVLAKLPEVFAALAPAQEEVPVVEVVEVGDRKLVNEMATSEAAKAATQRAKELTEKRLKLDLRAQLGKLELILGAKASFGLRTQGRARLDASRAHAAVPHLGGWHCGEPQQLDATCQQPAWPTLCNEDWSGHRHHGNPEQIGLGGLCQASRHVDSATFESIWRY